VLPVGFGVNALASRLRRRLAAAGLATTDSYTGLDEAGSFDAARFESSLTGLRRGRGSVEINVHPGEAGDPDLGRFAWGYHWSDELAMLLAPRTRSLIEAGGFRLGTFAELTARRPPQ